MSLKQITTPETIYDEGILSLPRVLLVVGSYQTLVPVLATLVINYVPTTSYIVKEKRQEVKRQARETKKRARQADRNGRKPVAKKRMKLLPIGGTRINTENAIARARIIPSGSSTAQM